MIKTLPKQESVNARQIAFFCAFLLPVSKFLEVPSLLAKYAKGDLLLPAILHFLLQSTVLFLVLYALSTSEKNLHERLKEKLGKWLTPLYILYGAYYLFYGILPLLDLEKFIYAAFSDTEPTIFSFAFFFFLSAFICSQSIRSVGRSADLCLFLFLVPFLALIGMSLSETDFSGLLPLFGTKFGDTLSAFRYTTPHFSDVALLLPLFLHYTPKQGDTKKIMAGYGVGAFFSLLFFAVFFALFSSISQREHYAFSKIAQYFPALQVIGRIDLIFVYLLSIVLLFYTCLPLQYAVDFTIKFAPSLKRVFLSFAINFLAFLFVLYFNKYYNSLYRIISGTLPVVFWLIADLLPIFLLLFKEKKNV